MKIGLPNVQRVLGLVFVTVLVLTFLPSVAAEPTQQGTSIIYYVRYGDTLFSIALRYGTTVPAIMQANGLTSEQIYAGQRLIIPLTPMTPALTFTPFPTPSNFNCTYSVQYRDTVYSIAYRYGVSPAILMQANYMHTPYLRVGQTLRVPCLAQTPTPFPTHIVAAGQNLLRIAIEYETSIYAIAWTNGIWNPHLIFAGQNLVIPYPGSKKWPPIPTVTPRGPTNTPGPTGTATTPVNTPTRTPTRVPTTPLVTPTRTPTGATPTATPFTGTPAAVIIMQNLRFVPETVTIPRGGTVMWQNVDSVNHSVRSGSPGAPGTAFNSGPIVPGGKFYHTFTTSGTFPFYSDITPQPMTGTVIVQ